MQNIEKIYEEYSNAVYKYLFCLTGKEDIAEELTQETFVIALKKINKFKGECKVSVWLCQIAKHLWYKKLKKDKKHSNIPIEELSEEMQAIETVEDIVCRNEDKLKLFKDMQKLDEKTREVMYLRLVGNLNFIEIGEILGKTPNWARVTFYRAKQKIKEKNSNEKNIRKGGL